MLQGPDLCLVKSLYTFYILYSIVFQDIKTIDTNFLFCLCLESTYVWKFLFLVEGRNVKVINKESIQNDRNNWSPDSYQPYSSFLNQKKLGQGWNYKRVQLNSFCWKLYYVTRIIIFVFLYIHKLLNPFIIRGAFTLRTLVRKLI